MAIDGGLPRMRRLLAELGNPEKDFRVIHIAGTNGKGSTAVMIASILEEAGYSVGLYTSPHLELEAERVQIWSGGEHSLIDQDHFEELMNRVRQAGAVIADEPVVNIDESDNADINGSNCQREDAEMTAEEGTETDIYGPLHVFEVYTAAAYLYFREIKPDYVVLECGLGGRLDSTNTLDKPLCSVITHIGLDHTAELGRTIYKVTREKAGIIKPGVPVVSQSPEMAVSNILRQVAAERGCEFHDASDAAAICRGYEIGMKGEHQLRNAATAVMAVRAAGTSVSEDAVRRGLARAYIPGRFEVLGRDPYWIIDGAHNPDAIESLMETFDRFARTNKIRRTLIIFGCMKDKNSSRMIQLLTEGLRGATYATVAVDYGRAEDPETLGEMIAGRGRSCTCYDSVKEAFRDAMASDFECVLITGSIYLAGEMRTYYLSHN